MGCGAAALHEQGMRSSWRAAPALCASGKLLELTCRAPMSSCFCSKAACSSATSAASRSARRAASAARSAWALASACASSQRLRSWQRRKVARRGTMMLTGVQRAVPDGPRCCCCPPEASQVQARPTWSSAACASLSAACDSSSACRRRAACRLLLSASSSMSAWADRAPFRDSCSRQQGDV